MIGLGVEAGIPVRSDQRSYWIIGKLGQQGLAYPSAVGWNAPSNLREHAHRVP